MDPHASDGFDGSSDYGTFADDHRYSDDRFAEGRYESPANDFDNRPPPSQQNHGDVDYRDGSNFPSIGGGSGGPPMGGGNGGGLPMGSSNFGGPSNVFDQPPHHDEQFPMHDFHAEECRGGWGRPPRGSGGPNRGGGGPPNNGDPSFAGSNNSRPPSLLDMMIAPPGSGVAAKRKWEMVQGSGEEGGDLENRLPLHAGGSGGGSGIARLMDEPGADQFGPSECDMPDEGWSDGPMQPRLGLRGRGSRGGRRFIRGGRGDRGRGRGDRGGGRGR